MANQNKLDQVNALHIQQEEILFGNKNGHVKYAEA